MNLCSPTYTDNKGLCEDLTEGKFSFPIIHSIRSNPGNLQLLSIIKQKPKDIEVKKYAVKYMENTGSFEYCRKVLETLEARARKLVAEVDAQDEETGKGKAGGVLKIIEMMAV
jgi:geranylgeranyl diphosphate synthase type 3